jgi:zinc protease
MENRSICSDPSATRTASFVRCSGRTRPVRTALVLLAVVLSSVSPARAAHAEAGGWIVERRPGGPEIILERHPESDVACLAVAVEAGSAYETPETRGISHFLEHMVFDGSERYSRLEISDWIDGTGAFLNAFTRKETTVYFLVVPSGELEQAIEILSQMLLHSTFPVDEFEKERKVILEEIGKSMDDPASVRERLVERYLYRGSRLSEPIIGYPATIGTISREQIIRCYREHYRPARMRVYLIGGFDAQRARGWLSDYFSGTEAATSATRGSRAGAVPRWSNEVTVRTDEGLEPGLDILMPFSSPLEPGFPAALITADLLAGERSPLPGLFSRLSLPEPEVSLEVHSAFSAIRIHVPAGGRHDDYLEVTRALTELSGWKPSPEEVEAARTSFLSSEVFDREKYHFYIMLNGERVALFGTAYLTAALDGVSGVGERDCRRLIERSFSQLRFNACLIEPSMEMPAPAGGPRSFETSVLGNGCTALAVQRTGSGVAAFHLLVGGRNCREGVNGQGMTVMLHHLLESSSAGKELAARLGGLGARVEWADNPYIPFDDYFLSPSYSFVRLEAPAERIETAIEQLVGHLRRSPITGEDLAQAGGPLRMELRVRGGSAAAALEKIVYRELFGDHPYGRSMFPGQDQLEAVSPSDLEEFRRCYVTAGDMIASLVSPLPPADALGMLERLLSSLPQGTRTVCPPPPGPGKHAPVEEPTDKEGIYLAAGWYHPLEDPGAAAALLVAAEILSRRMQLELREKQGLAYSTGCSVELLPEGAVVIASIGTRAQNIDAADAGLRGEIERISSGAPGPEEVRTAVNRLVGRRSRSELSSINEAHAAGRDLFVTGEPISLKGRIERVTAAEVTAAAGLFPLDRAVFVRLVPSGEGRERTMPPAMRMKTR